MAFDGVVLKALTNEFNTKLKGLRIDKIYQPEKDEVVIGLRGYKENYKLFISADSNYPRINITANNYQNPDKPPLFCMLLRKHLASGKIISFTQIGSDRILDIAVSAYNELGDSVEKHLIIEIMGRHSNIILVDDNKIVIDSIKRVDFTVSSKRQLLPGLLYEMAPSQEKLDISQPDSDYIRDKLYGSDDIEADKFMMDIFSGVSPILSREISFKALNESKCVLTKNDLIKKASLYREIENYLVKFNNGEFESNILYAQSEPKFFSVVKLEQYGGYYKRVDFESPSKMIDAFYNELHFSRKIKLRSMNLTKHIVNLIEKLRKKINIHNDTLLNKDKYEQYKLKGELLSANIYLLKGGESSIKVFNYYNGNEIEIELDKKLSPAKNIDRYYKLYKKGQKAMEYAIEQIETAKKELEYLEGELVFLENAKSQQDIDDIKDELIKEGYLKENSKDGAKKKKSDKPEILTHKTSDGFEIFIGKNSRQNEYITFKLSKGNDLWFHVKNYPGAHVLLKSNNDDFSEGAILCAAEFAAQYSKNSIDKVTVDYTKIKYVKKIPGGKPGMVTYTNYSSVVVDKKGDLT